MPEMIVEISSNRALTSPRVARARATEEDDFTARVTVDGLDPNTTYHYRVRFDASEPVTGSFRTAPPTTAAASVRFIVMGDLGGHGYCREEGKGYAVFSAMEELEPDFLVANGDMIYADSECPAAERPEERQKRPGWISASIDDPTRSIGRDARGRSRDLASPTGATTGPTPTSSVFSHRKPALRAPSGTTTKSSTISVPHGSRGPRPSSVTATRRSSVKDARHSSISIRCVVIPTSLTASTGLFVGVKTPSSS